MPMPDPQVSIVIPCYNDGRFLAEALGSLRDSPVPLEIVIVDDGSTEPETLAVIEALEQRPDLTIIRQKNSGLGAARNAGIARTRSEFFVPLDADNLLCPETLRRGLDLMASDARIAVVHGDAEVFGQRTYTWKNGPLDRAAMAVANPIDNCVLLRKAAWADAGGYEAHKDYQSSCDWLLWLGLLLRGWRFAYLEGTFFHYRLRAGSMLRTDGADMRREARICAYFHAFQKRLLEMLVAEQALSPRQARTLLGRVELRLAHTQLIYGNFGEGLRAWSRALRLAPLLLKDHLRVLLVCPLKRIVLDLFKIDLRLS